MPAPKQKARRFRSGSDAATRRRSEGGAGRHMPARPRAASRPAPVVGTPFLVGHLADALHMVLKLDGPADVLLSVYFKRNHELGSRDRGVIAETVYFALRHLASLSWGMAPAAPARAPRLAALVAVAWKFGRGELSESAVGRDKEALEAILAKPLDRMPAAAKAEVPGWLYEKITAQYEDAQGFFRAIAEGAPLDVRVNSLKATVSEAMKELDQAGIAAVQMRYSPDGLRLKEKVGLGSLPVYREGRIEIQDEGSQLIARLLAPKRREMVCDFCAGAGGKTLAIGAMMRSTGSLYAFDINAKRLEGMVPRLRRSGLDNVRRIAIRDEHDKRLGRLAAKFDRVLVDAPCSGTGTLRRNPDLRWRLSPEELSRINAVQASVLRSAAKLLKEGGRLVYATCSVLKEENQDVVEAFLAEHPEFVLKNAASVLEAQGVAFSDAEKAQFGDWFAMLPQRQDTDGFFAAVLEKTGKKPQPRG